MQYFILFLLQPSNQKLTVNASDHFFYVGTPRRPIFVQSNIFCLVLLWQSTQDMLIGSIPVVGDISTKQVSLFDLNE